MMISCWKVSQRWRPGWCPVLSTSSVCWLSTPSYWRWSRAWRGGRPRRRRRSSGSWGGRLSRREGQLSVSPVIFASAKVCSLYSVQRTIFGPFLDPFMAFYEPFTSLGKRDSRKGWAVQKSVSSARFQGGGRGRVSPPVMVCVCLSCCLVVVYVESWQSWPDHSGTTVGLPPNDK